MEIKTHSHHDLSDGTWDMLAPLLPGRKGCWGRVAQDNRKFMHAVFWILRTGAPWRTLPPDYGDWKNTHRRFSRWCHKGIWKVITFPCATSLIFSHNKAPVV